MREKHSKVSNFTVNDEMENETTREENAVMNGEGNPKKH